MKMRKIGACVIALSMLLCQNLVLPITAEAAAGDAPLIYYDFGDTAEWDSTDILAYTSDANAENAHGVNPEKRVREYTNNYHVSFVNDGDYGQVLQMPAGGNGWKYMDFYIDDGTGSFNTDQTLYMKVAFKVSDRDAVATDTNIQLLWNWPWTNQTNVKNNISIATNDGWYVFSGTLAASSNSYLTSKGAMLTITHKLNDAYEIKYIALFDSAEARDSWDPSIDSATFDGNAMTVDNGNRTMSLTLGGVTPESLTSIDDKISITKECDAVSVTKNGDPTVTETAENVTVTQNYNVTDMVGNVTSWTAIVSSTIIAPAEPYLFFDFTTLPFNEWLRLQDGTHASDGIDSRPYGYEIGKTSVNPFTQAYTAQSNYGGPGIYINGAGSGTYTQFLLYSDKFDMTNTKYVRIEFSPNSTSTELGNGGAGRVIARWEDTNGNGNEVSYPAGNPPEARKMHTAIVQVDPVNSNNKIMCIGFYNFAPDVIVKSLGVFESRAEAEVFDPSLRSVVIKGKKAAINGITHTATVEIADNILPADMPTLTSSDITSIVCDNVGATTQNSYTHQAATAAVVADSQEITEDLTSVMSSINYTVTDKTGTAHTWKMIAKSKKDGMIGKGHEDQYYIYDFTNAETVQKAILDGSIVARNDNLADMYPANTSLTSSALHTVKDSGGRVGLEFDFPNDEVTYRWYAKTLLNYDGAVNGNVQIHWSTNWGTTGTDSDTGEDRTYVTLNAEQWKTVSTNLSLASVAQPLGLYSGAGQNMNFKYIALFGTAADRDAFDPSVIGGTITKSGTKYRATVNNIAHTVTFPTGCGNADDLDSAVLTLYNGGTGVTAVSDGAATVAQNFAGAPYELKKSYTVTGLDGSQTTWTAIIPFTTAVSFSSAGNTVTATFADQLSRMMNCIALYQTENNVLYFAANNNGEIELTADTSSLASGTYTLKAFSFYDGNILPVIKEQTHSISK